MTANHEVKYFDAFVLSKGINSFSIVDDLDNQSEEIRVAMADKEDKSVISTLKKKDKVRTWHDFIRETYPGQTTAYRVEVLEE